MSEPPINVQVDNRIRLLSCILALTTWPVQEQDRCPHGVHVHARNTRAFLAEAEGHPAVTTMQELLESGLGLDTIFSYAGVLNWPGLRAKGMALPDWAPRDWSAQIRDFMHANRVRNLWERDAPAWETATQEAQRALSIGDPLGFLSRFFGPLDVGLIFHPNIGFPTAQTLGFRSGNKLFCVCPPPIAWGNNPPWPYDTDPVATYRDAFGAYAQVLLREYLDAHPREAELAQRTQLPVPNTFRARHPDWFDQFAVIFVSGLTVLFITETFGDGEAKAYILMAHKAHGFTVLPTVVDVLRHYLEGVSEGKFTAFAEYMPTFCKTLRIAERIKKL